MAQLNFDFMKPIEFIKPKDLMVMTNKSYITCWRIVRAIRDTFNVPKTRDITRQELETYWGLKL